ncbi:MAG: alpha-hydroxy acid oxidase [Catenulispora sp.]
MLTTVPPEAAAALGTAAAAVDALEHWGIRRAVRLAFPGPASLALDEEHTARLDTYLTDLLQQYDLELAPGALAPLGQSYGEMAEALIELAVPGGEGVDLLVMAYSIPDITPGRATTTYLSHVCPGGPLAFAVSDQGTAAGFTALRLIREYARTAGLRRALLVVVEQAWLAYDPGVPAVVPAGHTGVALLFGDGVGADSSSEASDTLAGLGSVRIRAGDRVARTGIEEFGDTAGAENQSVILGAVLQSEADALSAGTDIAFASAGRPTTGVWWELVAALEAPAAGSRRVVLADADLELGFLCSATIDIHGRRPEGLRGPESEGEPGIEPALRSLAASLLCLDDYRTAAQEQVPPDVWDFIEGGAQTERTVAANCRAFTRVTLRPRALVDTEVCDTRTTVLGAAVGTPLAVAPTAYHRLVHPDGEVETARGAAAADALYTVSIFASRTLEDIAAAASGPLWLQLYWLRRRDALTALIDRAAEAGYRALVLTVDIPRMGRRLRDMRNSFAVGPDCAAVNLDAALMASAHTRGAGGTSALAVHTAQAIDPSVTWSDLAWLRARSELPIVLKGILTAEDARLAVENGADAVIVSNHGGRQLDGAVPSLVALPEVVAAVGDGCPVLFDGGVRGGGDAFAALALGARAVFLGRPVLWGLAVAGAAGVCGVLRQATEELAHTMALAGRPGLEVIDRSAVRFDERTES